jgi:fluoroquinolone transport system ATP-binding protein
MIEVRDLVFGYPGGRGPAVAGIAFSVPAGEIFGFLGPSGAGKSTTQKILVGLLRGYQGTVAVLGHDLREDRPDFYERIGVGFEAPTLYLKLTALENLDAFRALYSGPTEDPLELLERVGLAQDANVRVSQFSKGMKVRLGFARALLPRPELLFLDEPTAGLDPVSARRVKDLIRERRDAGTTVFLTTHDMSVADELCDRVAFIVEGTIRCVDSPRNLKLRYGRRQVRVEVAANGGIERFEFDLDGLGEDAEFLRLLRERKLETLHTLETTLDQVFIEVTGRSLA